MIDCPLLIIREQLEAQLIWTLRKDGVLSLKKKKNSRTIDRESSVQAVSFMHTKA